MIIKEKNTTQRFVDAVLDSAPSVSKPSVSKPSVSKPSVSKPFVSLVFLQALCLLVFSPIDIFGAGDERQVFLEGTQVMTRYLDGSEPIPYKDPHGNEVNLYFVDGIGGGDGSHSSPMQIDEAQNKADQGDILVLLGNNGAIQPKQTIVLKDHMRLVAPSGSNSHRLKLGETAILDLKNRTHSGPVIIEGLENGKDVLQLGSNNVIHDVTIQGGTRGIVGRNITHATLRNITFNHTHLSSITLQGVKGSFSFDNVKITNNSGVPVSIIGSNATVIFLGGSITQSGNADTVSVSKNDKSFVLFLDSAISATAGGGLVFNGANGTYYFNSKVSMKGTINGVNISNDSAGTFSFFNMDITGTSKVGMALGGSGQHVFNTTTMNMEGKAPGISIDRSKGRYMFTDVNIRDASKYGMGVGESNAEIHFNSGSIKYTKNGSAFIFHTGHNFNGTFKNLEIEADSHSALQFNSAKGTFSFLTSSIFAASGATGVNLTGNYKASITFNGVTIDGNNLINVSDNDESYLTFLQSRLIATTGHGILLNSANGTYDFTKANININGAKQGIAITGNSNGTAKFKNVRIQYTQEAGIYLNNPYGTPTVTISGGIINNADHSKLGPLSVAKNDKSHLTLSDITLTARSGNGLVLDGVKGTYRFSGGAIHMNGPDSAIQIENVGTDATLSFNNVDITGANQTALIAFNNSALPVTFTKGSITQKNDFPTLTVSGSVTSDLTFNNTRIFSTSGEGLVFNDAQAVYTFTGVTMNMEGVASGIHISNTKKGSFLFNNTTIRGRYRVAPISMTNSSAALQFKNGSITQNGNGKILSLSKGDSSHLTFSGTDITATAGEGLVFDGVQGSYTFNANGEIKTKINLGTTGSIAISNVAKGSLNFGGVEINGNSTANTTALLKLSGNTNTANNPIRFQNGSITYSGAGKLISVLTDHGNFAFNSTDITATAGEGMAFSGANGSYAFLGTEANLIMLRKTTHGVKISDGSTGTFTFANANISRTIKVPVSIDNGSSIAKVIFTGGSINPTDGEIFGLGDGDKTNLNFSGTGINITQGNGLVFNNANGNYTFSGTAARPIVLKGTTHGVKISGKSTGRFKFTHTSIQETSGIAVEIMNSNNSIYHRSPNSVVTFNHSLIQGTIQDPRKDSKKVLIHVGGPYVSNDVTFENSQIVSRGIKGISLKGAGRYTFDNVHIKGVSKNHCVEGQLLDNYVVNSNPRLYFSQLHFNDSTMKFYDYNNNKNMKCNKSIVRIIGHRSRVQFNSSKMKFISMRPSNRVGFLFDECYNQKIKFSSSARIENIAIGFLFDQCLNQTFNFLGPITMINVPTDIQLFKLNSSNYINFSNVNTYRPNIEIKKPSPRGQCNNRKWTSGNNNCPQQ